MKKHVAARMAVVGVAGALTLVGCTAEAGSFIKPGTLGERVAIALAAEVGSETVPNVDCGDENIFPKEGLVVMCVLSVDGDTAEYDVTVWADPVS